MNPNWGWLIGAAIFSPIWVLEIIYRRKLLGHKRFLAHRRNLAEAQAQGEGGILFRAMQCAICGGFHPEDDDDCPKRVATEEKHK
jgi:hypothetical protein